MLQNWNSRILCLASKSLRELLKPYIYPPNTPNHKRGPYNTPNLSHYKRSPNPKAPSKLKGTPSIPQTLHTFAQGPKYRFNTKGSSQFCKRPPPAPNSPSPRYNPSKARHAPKAPPTREPRPLRREEVEAHTHAHKKTRPAHSLLSSRRCAAGSMTSFRPAPLLTEPRVRSPANERPPFGAVPI